MEADAVRTLSELRFAHAEECLRDARSLLADGSVRSAVNRAYYSAFHAMRSVLVFDGIDMKHHSGIISEFRRLYINTGLIDAEQSRAVSELFNSRTGCDYDDYYLMTEEDAARLVELSESFLNAVRLFLETRS